MTGTERFDRATFLAGEDPVAYVSGQIPARRTAVTELRHLIVGFARRHGADPELASRIALAVSEAVANAVVHAYAGQAGPPGLVHYAADVGDGDLELVIADDGDGLQAGRPSDGLGLGLNLSADLSDDFAISARHPGLEVWMRFRGCRSSPDRDSRGSSGPRSSGE